MVYNITTNSIYEYERHEHGKLKYNYNGQKVRQRSKVDSMMTTMTMTTPNITDLLIHCTIIRAWTIIKLAAFHFSHIKTIPPILFVIQTLSYI